MSEKEREIWDVITSILNGSGTREEYETLNAWLEESDENQQTYQLLSKVRSVKTQPLEGAKERILKKIQAQIGRTGLEKRLLWSKYGNIAAVFVIVILGAALLWPKAKTSDSLVETRSPYGSKSKVVLADGTLVYLNSGSVLTYPSAFSTGTRHVNLVGEAYFEVKKDPEHPFVVNTHAFSIKVLGTHFNVKAFSDEQLTETSLVEGSVALYQNSDPNHEMCRLKPNEKVIFNEKERQFKIQRVDAVLETSWRDGEFYFDNETLSSIVKNLERNFNVPIRICSNELKEEVFSGLFDKSRTLYQTLDIMKLHKNFYYQTKNDSILIFFKPK